MIRITLCRHTSTPSTAIRALDVELRWRSDGELRADFVLDADVDAVAIPRAEAGEFRNELWRHTCFELFAAGPGGTYREFNFSPSTHYAVYDFSGYRAGMQPVNAGRPPSIEIGRGGLTMSVRVAAELIPLDQHRVLRLGVAAIVEERGGALTYWAARHPGDRPDFHDFGGFIVSLPPDTDDEER